MKKELNIITFDADDTLWENEPFFRENEQRFCELVNEYADSKQILDTLLKNEVKTLPIYGYGIKGFVLSMIETALELSNNQVSGSTIKKIMQLGKEQLSYPVKLIDGVEDTLSALQGNYILVMATKGDLTDQERKIEKSGLKKYFSHIEIMREKNESGYQSLLNRLQISPDKFLMVGNSLKSDIIPVLSIGGYAAHIPFYTTWEHEKVDDPQECDRMFSLNSIRELLSVI
ncbi:HAD family hydrolase [Coprobacter sp.]